MQDVADKMAFDTNAVYVRWLREIKRYGRSKARILGSIVSPVFFMLGLGFGLSTFIRLPNGTSYLEFLVPGIVGMTLLFTGVMSGFMVIWDRQFGFLKEIMVTPNSRISIALGRIAGGATTAIVPSVLVLLLGLLIGFHIVLSAALLFAILFIILIGIVFNGLGLIFASFIDDPQAFGVIINFITFPLLFISGALFPLDGLPKAIGYIADGNPLTYGVDGIRYALTQTSTMSVWVDAAALLVFAVIIVALTAAVFEKAKMY